MCFTKLCIVCFTSDIDECTEQTARCTDICRNTIGSYTCSCHPGYFLNETDNAQCHGVFDMNIEMSVNFIVFEPFHQ